MSGVVGADRISRDDYYDTGCQFEQKCLRQVPEYLHGRFTGSYVSNLKKNDFGDIDLLVLLRCDTLHEAKEALIKQFESNQFIIPFEYKGKIKKFHNAGELLSVKTFQYDSPDTVQVDCIICLTEEEFKFKRKFLDIPAEIQGLLLGLVKVSRFGMHLNPNKDYEWDLSSRSLRLRKPDKSIVAEFQDWSLVESLLNEYQISSDFMFNQIIKKIKTLDERSIARIKGLFKKMVTVKSGEVGTNKGNEKLKHLKIVGDL